MADAPSADDLSATERTIREIEVAYPDWAVWVASETGRWWASRRRALTRAQQRAGGKPFLHANDPNALRTQLSTEQQQQHTARPTSKAAREPGLLVADER